MFYLSRSCSITEVSPFLAALNSAVSPYLSRLEPYDPLKLTNRILLISPLRVHVNSLVSQQDGDGLALAMLCSETERRTTFRVHIVRVDAFSVEHEAESGPSFGKEGCGLQGCDVAVGVQLVRVGVVPGRNRDIDWGSRGDYYALAYLARRIFRMSL